MAVIHSPAPQASCHDLPALMSLMTGDAKHTAAATSTLDVLWVLYDRVLRVSPATAGDDGRDRFFLSKGHGPMAYYAVLAAKGWPGGIEARFTAEGWAAARVSGRDQAALAAAFTAGHPGRPQVVVAVTEPKWA